MSLNRSVTEDEDSLRAPLAQDWTDDELGEPFPTAPRPQAGEGYRDGAFMALFWIQAIIVLAIALARGLPAVARGSIDIEIVDPDSQAPGSPGEDGGGPGRIVAGLLLTLLLAALLAAAAVQTLLRFGEGLIRCALLSTVAWFGLAAVGFFAAGVVAAGIIMLLAAIFSYVYYRLVAKRVEFAGKNLRVACAAVSAVPGTVAAAFAMLAVNCLWCLVWGLALLGAATTYGDATVTGPNGSQYPAKECTTYKTEGPSAGFGPSCDDAMAGETCFKCICNDVIVFADRQCVENSVNGGLYVALLLSLYWGCMTLSNMVHATTAGAVGAWWFNKNPGPRPVRDSLRRAATTSFGSVCMASLLAAVVRVGRLVLALMRRNRNRLGAFVLAIVDCLLAAIEAVVSVFNRYALCYCAIYGADLRTAGRETWSLFGRRGWTAIVNDQLVDNALTLACIAVAALCTLCGLAAGWLLGVTGGAGMALLAAFGAFAGFFMATVSMSVVGSAVATVFVCFATDHLVFGSTHPDLHLQLLQAWSKFYGPIMVNCGYTM